MTAEADSPAAATPPEAAEQGLRRRVKRALLWSILGNVVGRAGSSLTAIVLARLLLPADYGVYAVALVALYTLLSVNELGVSLAIVRWPGTVDRIAPTVMTLAMVSSLVLYAACFTAAPVIAAMMHAPEATPLLRVLALGVLVDAATAVPAALLTREFMQGRRLVIDVVCTLTSATVSVTLAIGGAGAWSLVWGTLAGNVLSAALITCWSPQRFRPGFDAAAARELLSFGLPLAAASLLFVATLNVQYVIVGRVLGPESVGFFLLAFNLANWPVILFSTPVRRVALPAFARLQEDPSHAGEVFVRTNALLVAVTLPACLLLAVFADQLVGFVYGDRWLPAAQALPFLAVLALGRVFAAFAYDFLTALGRTSSNLVLQAVWLAALVPALSIGARVDGIRGAAVGQAVVTVVVVVPLCGLLLSRAGVSLRAMASHCGRPLAGAVLAGALSAAALILVDGRFLQMAVGGTLVLIGYVAVVHPMRRLAVGTT